MTRFLLALLTGLLVTVCPTVAQAPPGATAPLLEGMGTHHRPINTEAAMAQRYFDQGLVLSYAFNHAEAARSFREAARLDPACAMCSWGEALVLGPNINAGMEPADAVPAYEAVSRARRLKANASPRNQALIEALATRYTAQPPSDRSALDQAYAEAMAHVARQFPNDADIQALYAEALMDTMPWDYWHADGSPKAETARVLRVLDTALKLQPDHPGALHLYIHTVEKQRPELGVAMADRLGSLVPGAGHLVHMPGHIYMRVGRYHDAVVANQQAILADDAYVTQCHAQGLYPLAYMPHNHHFLWSAASLAGEHNAAMQAAQHIAMHTDQETMRAPGLGTLQHFFITPLFAHVRFGAWDALIATPAPAADLLYPTGVWHYARGLALVRKGRFEEARASLDVLQALAANPALDAITIWDINGSRDVLAIAAQVLAGELAAAQGDYPVALAHLRLGVALEDNLNYDEPPTWHQSVRLNLGAVLLDAGQAAAAETVFQAELARFPENGWGLFGLLQSLQAQGKRTATAAVQARFDAAWQHAEIALTAARF